MDRENIGTSRLAQSSDNRSPHGMNSTEIPGEQNVRRRLIYFLVRRAMKSEAAGSKNLSIPTDFSAEFYWAWLSFGSEAVIDESGLSRDNKRVATATRGPVAQLGARFHGMEEVIGSIPIRSTNLARPAGANFAFLPFSGRGLFERTFSPIWLVLWTSVLGLRSSSWRELTIVSTSSGRTC
jgi:hypothetical protein